MYRLLLYTYFHGNYTENYHLWWNLYAHWLQCVQCAWNGRSFIHSLKHVISIKLFFVATAVFTLHFNFHGLFILPLFSSSFPIWHHLFSGNCFFSGNYIHKMCKPDFHTSFLMEFLFVWCFIQLHLACIHTHSIRYMVYPNMRCWHNVCGGPCTHNLNIWRGLMTLLIFLRRSFHAYK